MTDSRGRNAAASQNGAFCEDYARRMIPGIQWKGELCDAEYGKHPVDIKGCEAWYSRSDRSNNTRRAGRFTLIKEQHAELMAKNGFYFCVVHCGELVVRSFFVPAVRVPTKKQIS